MRTSIAVALLLVAVSAYSQGGGPLPDRTPRPALRWQPFYADDGRFSLSMPGQPVFKSETLTAKNGRPVVYKTYTVDLGRSAYMISTSDYDQQTKISLDGAIDGAISSWENRQIISRRSTTLFGYPAQIVDLISGNYRVEVRAIAVGKRLYQLGFVEMLDDFLPVHLSTFMQSLRLRY